MTNRFAMPILILSSLLISLAHAEEIPADSSTAATFETSSDGRYLNGGIGVEEANAMRLQAANYPLRIQFSQGKDGKSVAGVAVTISDSKGKQVIDIPDAGPLLYIKLANGSYKLTAQYNGATLTKKVSVAGKKGSTVYLNWRSTPADASPASGKIEDATVTPMADPAAPSPQ